MIRIVDVDVLKSYENRQTLLTWDSQKFFVWRQKEPMTCLFWGVFLKKKKKKKKKMGVLDYTVTKFGQPEKKKTRVLAVTGHTSRRTLVIFETQLKRFFFVL